MMEIRFSGSSTENVIRQIIAYAKMHEGMVSKRAGKHERVEQPKPVFFSEEEQSRMVGYKNRGL